MRIQEYEAQVPHSSLSIAQSILDGEDYDAGTTGRSVVPWVAVSTELPILYTKRDCPWCREVVEFLDGHGISYRLRDVTDDAGARAEMEKKSGQSKAPTLDWRGRMLADFGVEELVPFLRSENVKLEDS